MNKEDSDKKKFVEWIKANKQILKQMFSGNLVTDRKEIKKYFDIIWKIWENLPKRYLLAHSTIENSIANYFDIMEWDIGFEIPFGDLDSSYRFDIMAQKGSKTIVVEVKPEITTRDLGQILGYVFDIEKKFKGKGRVFLGTDIMNFDLIVNGGEISDIILDNAKHGLGVILADKDMAWIIPAEFLLI